ncbi:NAD(P)/FAD-dependent oxidoreductase [Cohnella zeiphila]|uniref:FAD-dependent oxidoreductase n=1 Tax=Cohnella zeiphila TaxID=2761120 RepID=A0A7X0SP80_9BACL|nr:FAD-dependent oxidoreductase [Cohnella zeiphila]MBB6733637.1 FAD-dependent oxidoreductase [Cohnella zeiphila]
MNDYGMVIVGAGEAGVRAALELRSRGWNGSVTLIGDEAHAPYERPPLSKRVLCEPEEPAPPTIADPPKLGELGIAFLSGDGAVRIDRQSHVVRLASGREVPYERLLLATGASPRKLAVQGNAAGEMLYLRKFGDALALRDRLRPGKRVAVIGGGFIGLEVAAGAVTNGCEVTLIEAAPRILMRGVPEPIAERVERRHREAGVAFRIGGGIASVDRAGDELTVALADGTAVRCDAIVTGIGAVPETSLAADSGLEIENGVKANERLQTSDPDIYAAGDCCSFPHPLYDGRRIRLEAWRNAQDQGTHAAGNLLGDEASYAAVPWFWSDQYDQTLQVSGLADADQKIVRRDLGEQGQLYFHLAADGRLMSASGMGPEGAVAKEIRLAERLIESRARPSVEALSDPGRKLKELLRS